MHREGVTIKRGRGRPKGSRGKKPEDGDGMALQAPRTIVSAADKPCGGEQDAR